MLEVQVSYRICKFTGFIVSISILRRKRVMANEKLEDLCKIR